MFLSDKTIKEFISKKKIIITPPIKDADIRPTGIRLHLDGEILIPCQHQKIDFEKTRNVKYKNIDISNKHYCLRRGDFVLCSTIEKIQTSRDLICILDGRSTNARIGLTIHCTSFTFDNNYDELKTVVLEISNVGPFEILLKKGIPIGLLLFSKLTSLIKQESHKQYINQNKVLAPNLSFKNEFKKF